MSGRVTVGRFYSLKQRPWSIGRQSYLDLTRLQVSVSLSFEFSRLEHQVLLFMLRVEYMRTANEFAILFALDGNVHFLWKCVM
jgi:hypothetical protein